MNRLALTSTLLIAVGVLAAACSDATSRSATQSSGYFTTAGAPLVVPYDQNNRSDMTAQEQRASGYFATPDAPLVAPDEGNADAGSTAKKQSDSGYFPAAGAPLVSPTTTGVR